MSQFLEYDNLIKANQARHLIRSKKEQYDILLERFKKSNLELNLIDMTEEQAEVDPEFNGTIDFAYNNERKKEIGIELIGLTEKIELAQKELSLLDESISVFGSKIDDYIASEASTIFDSTIAPLVTEALRNEDLSAEQLDTFVKLNSGSVVAESNVSMSDNPFGKILEAIDKIIADVESLLSLIDDAIMDIKKMNGQKTADAPVAEVEKPENTALFQHTEADIERVLKGDDLPPEYEEEWKKASVSMASESNDQHTELEALNTTEPNVDMKGSIFYSLLDDSENNQAAAKKVS